jgi:hypothetical protein
MPALLGGKTLLTDVLTIGRILFGPFFLFLGLTALRVGPGSGDFSATAYFLKT